MLVKKLRSFARGAGWVIIGLLVIYNIISLLSNAERALGAPGESSPLRALSALLFQNTPPVPTLINYQGMLRDSEGEPLNGQYEMTFRIYNDSEALDEDAIIWPGETISVTVRSGQFSVLLGDNIPLQPTHFTGPDRYIGVTVDPYGEMVPRQRFTSVPYAMVAHRAFSLNAADGEPFDAVFVDDDGQVGIGITSPQAKLDVRGDLVLESDKDPNIFGGTGPEELNRFLQLFNSPEARSALGLKAGGLLVSDSYAFANPGKNDLIVKGNVGIGTPDPSRQLHVKGTIPVLVLQDLDSTGASQSGYVSLIDSNGSEQGWFGFGSQQSTILGINNNHDDGILAFYTEAEEKMRISKSGDVDITSQLRIKSTAPVRIIRFKDLDNDATVDTGVSADEYYCVATGWSAKYDIDEDGTHNNTVWTYVKNNRWWIRVHFASHSNHEKPDVDVLCFRVEITSWEGASTSLNSAD